MPCPLLKYCPKKPAADSAAQLVIDESAAIRRSQALRCQGFWIAGLSVFVFWNTGTLVGVFIGEVVGNPQQWGLDATFPAAFLAFVSTCTGKEKHVQPCWVRS